jgi:hypothetical protein
MTTGELKSEGLILKDVKRTNFCMSQRVDLIKLLKRVSLNFPKTGYYQGMNCIGGFLLKYSGNYKTSLRIFNYLMEKRLSKYFTESFKHAKQLFYVCERLFELYLPAFYQHIKTIGLLAQDYLLKNHLTLFTACLQYIENFTLTANIIDLVIAEGWGGFFKVLIFFFKKLENKIIKMNYEKALVYLKEDIYQSLVNIDLETFKADISGIYIPKNLMMAIEYQYVDTGATVEEFWQDYYEKRKSARKTNIKNLK